MKTRSYLPGQSPHNCGSDHPLVVELIGLAGAGKTTLTRALHQRDTTVTLADDIKLRKWRDLAIFAGQMPFMMSEFLHPEWNDRRPSWDELKAMAYLHEWPHVLGNEVQDGYTTILLDHGPVFKLAKLYAFGPASLHSPAFAPWWRRIFEQWATTLDLVIWVDAPFEVLLGRIHSRHQKHVIKGYSELEARDFLQRYEAAYRRILGHLASYAGPLLVQIDTHCSSIDQVVDQILAACSARCLRRHASQE